jgi:hypothetical protein
MHMSETWYDASVHLLVGDDVESLAFKRNSFNHVEELDLHFLIIFKNCPSYF